MSEVTDIPNHIWILCEWWGFKPRSLDVQGALYLLNCLSSLSSLPSLRLGASWRGTSSRCTRITCPSDSYQGAHGEKTKPRGRTRALPSDELPGLSLHAAGKGISQLRTAVLGDREGSPDRWKRSLHGVAVTYKRVVEAARKARSKRPARTGRIEVMTIIQPLRRPGHVSMALGFFPAHIGTIQRLPIHPKAGCPSPFKLNTLQGLAAPWPHRASISVSLDQPLLQPLLHWTHLLDHSIPSSSLPQAHIHQADLRIHLVTSSSLQPGIEGFQMTDICHPTLALVA